MRKQAKSGRAILPDRSKRAAARMSLFKSRWFVAESTNKNGLGASAKATKIEGDRPFSNSCLARGRDTFRVPFHTPNATPAGNGTTLLSSTRPHGRKNLSPTLSTTGPTGHQFHAAATETSLAREDERLVEGSVGGVLLSDGRRAAGRRRQRACALTWWRIRSSIRRT